MRSATAAPAARRPLALAAAVLLLVSGVTFAVRAPLYEVLARFASDGPGLRGPVELLAGQGVLALLAAAAIVAVIAWRRGPESFALLVAAGAGAVAAYLASEIVKLVVEQERPCRTIVLETVLACPAPGDWSWPSNHATIAAGLATACILLVPRLWPVVAPIALLIGLSRVLAGVHYPHDVAAGLALGVGVTLAVSVLGDRVLAGVVRRAVSSAAGRTGRNR